MSYEDNDQNFNRRDRDNSNRREPSYSDTRPARTPLVWRTEKTWQVGRIVLVLQCADLDTGIKRRSFRIGKESQEQPDKPFPFVDPRDSGAVRELLTKMEEYLANNTLGL